MKEELVGQMADIAETIRRLQSRHGKKNKGQEVDNFDCEFAASTRRVSPKRQSLHVSKEAVHQLEQVVNRRASLRMQRPSVINPTIQTFHQLYLNHP